MASREKRPLAPSKSKQRANNESVLPTSVQSNRKRSQTSLRSPQLARNILEAVASGSQLAQKLEASLPRKKVLRSLRRKQKLRNAKSNLMSVKSMKKVPISNICRLAVDIKKGVKLKKVKRLVEADKNTRRNDEQQRVVVDDNVTEEKEDNNGETENETGGKITKNNLRTKKTKTNSKVSEESDNLVERETTDTNLSTNTKNSPKTTRKLKSTETPDTPSKSKTTKNTIRRNASKERDNIGKSRGASKEIDSQTSGSSGSSPDTKNSKKISTSSSSSIDLTIEEVVASMISDTENEDFQAASGKLTRSRKMLIDEKIFTDVEIKKEALENEDARLMSEEDRSETPQQETLNSIQLRNRTGNSFTQRSLRNGKLRQLNDSGIIGGGTPETEIVKKRRWLNMDESTTTESGVSEMSVDNISDGNIDGESSFSESSGNENASNVTSGKDDTSPLKLLESPIDFDRVIETSIELENNNNASGEVGPILRSKTKAKSSEVEIKIDDTEEPRPLGRSLANQLEPRKSGSLDQLRKDSLTKIVDCKPPKSRRSSLNIDVKKTMSSFYGNEKSDNGSKSQIDQMIENIKLTIAKSIESKIFGPEKSLVRNKNFEIPKIEEIVAPLSADSQKRSNDETIVNCDDGVQPNISNIDNAPSNSSENSVPKVADTAKEIEKLVMGENELVDTQNSESANIEISRDEQQVVEHRDISNDNVVVNEISVDSEKGEKIVEEESSSETDKMPLGNTVEDNENDQRDTAKKSIVTRKSLRIRSSNESIADLGNSVKSNSSVDDCEKSKVNLTTQVSHKEDTTENNFFRNSRMLVDTIDTIKVIMNETLVSENTMANDRLIDESLVFDTNSETKDTMTIERTEPSISNVPLNIEDSETLESISKEVERLVGETSNTIEKKIDNPEKNSKIEEISNEEKSNLSNVGENTSMHESINVIELLLNNAKNDENTTLHDECEIPKATSDDNEAVKVTEMRNTESCSNESQETGTSENIDKSTIDENVERDQENVESRMDRSSSRNEKNLEEQKITAEENRRVLRARDKMKKSEPKQGPRPTTEMNDATSKPEVDVSQDSAAMDETHEYSSEERATPDSKQDKETENPDTGDSAIKLDDMPVRTRRSREVKKRKEESSQPQNILKNKRSRKDVRKSDQQNKEETLLDDEVATINENNRSLVDKYSDKVHTVAESLRGFSEGGRGPVAKLQNNTDNNRSKSENDIENVKRKSECSGRLSRQRAESDTLKVNENVDGASDIECKISKIPETPPKDSDDASTSGESSSSLTLGSLKLDETPEDRAKKESILRLLGLESLEKAAERLNHQKARKEQYTGTLKTVIRVQKDKDKKRSRSPLKMVLKQGRGDGDGDSPEFYTIQKEFGTSGLGDSSSGANRKFSTNHRHSCGNPGCGHNYIINHEDNEEAPPKDRQSLVIPEKSSSFSIHPGRLCADVCCYCFGKFGSLDTPMHLAQMKSDERRQKILGVEKHLNKDSCLCDACYRHVDRRANMSPTNMQTKPQRQHRQLMVSKCSARDCREPARHHVKRRWLLKVKAVVQHQVDINWESSQHTSMSFCVDHYSKIEPYLTCALCKRRLAKNHTHPLAASETDELNQRLGRQGIPVHLVGGTFVCKLCRYFTQLQLKYKYSENMNASHRNFCKTYRVRILHCHDIEVFDAEEEDAAYASTSKDKEKRKKVKCAQNKSMSMSKSPDGMTNSPSEKSTPEPTMKSSDIGVSEIDSVNRMAKITSIEDVTGRNVQLMDLESTVEKLKKRKALEQLVYTSEPSLNVETRDNDVVQILAMDKEVTLTRLPKRPRVASDITPVVQRLGANPSISVRTLFPGEEEMNLHANVEFANVREITPQGWEKCATMIQYDRDTKILWQELQRPYGNQSSFLRHLILLEKYYRSGDLVLAPNASRNAINYSTSVQNRLISYEGPEKMDEPIMEPISSDYNSSRRMSGGYMMERERLSLPSTSTMFDSSVTKTTLSNSSGTTTQTTTTTLTITTTTTTTTTTAPMSITTSIVTGQTLKIAPPRILKLTSGVSIIKKPPPSLQRLSLPSGSSSNGNATSAAAAVVANAAAIAKRKEYTNKIPVTSGGKLFQLTEAEFRRLQNLKKQKQQLSEQKQSPSPASNVVASASVGSTPSNNATPINFKGTTLSTQYQKAQVAAQSQFHKHLRMQQEMLNRQTRGDFEPLICDVRSLLNENTPTQNLLNTLNLPKSIQVTTKPPNPIPILPKIPKSLTVIPQTMARPLDK